MPRLRKALKFLFNESVPVADRIDSLTQDESISVPGIGAGILTPLLLIRYPEEYGVWNSKAENALRPAARLVSAMPFLTGRANRL